MNQGILTVFITAGLYCLATSGWAQVQHNFKKGPENTDCHLIKEPFESTEKVIEQVESSTFRFVENITISRHKTPKAAKYYSCDGNTGFLIAVESDDKKKFYHNVPKTTWNEFIASNDPISFYKKKITPLGNP